MVYLEVPVSSGILLGEWMETTWLKRLEVTAFIFEANHFFYFSPTHSLLSLLSLCLSISLSLPPSLSVPHYYILGQFLLALIGFRHKFSSFCALKLWPVNSVCCFSLLPLFEKQTNNNNILQVSMKRQLSFWYPLHFLHLQLHNSFTHLSIKMMSRDITECFFRILIIEFSHHGKIIKSSWD